MGPADQTSGTSARMDRMVREALTWTVSWSLMLAVALWATLLLVGCETQPDAPRPPLAVPAAASEPPEAASSPETDAEAQAREMAERLNQQIGSDAQAGMLDGTFDPFADEPPLPSPTNAADLETAPAEAVSTSIPPAAAEVKVVPEPDQTPTQVILPMPATAIPDAARFSRAELLEALSTQMLAEENPALSRAVAAAGLSLTDPAHQMDERLLGSLKPLQREAVERLHQLFLEIDQSTHQSASSGSAADAPLAADEALSRKALTAAVAKAFADAPVSITTAELCRSVHSYGAYEPLGSHTFLSGQANRAIVYVEVDNFAAAPLDEGKFEVKLTQELILYKESDGLAVWRHEPTEIIDASRNHRRDFYTVQLITLPARLGEGRYRLKIRLTDEHGDSVDETTLPLDVVADPALAAASAAR